MNERIYEQTTTEINSSLVAGSQINKLYKLLMAHFRPFIWMRHLKRHLGFRKEVTSLTTARLSPRKDLQINPEKRKHIARLDNLTEKP